MEIDVLHALRDRKRWNQLYHAVPQAMLAGETQQLMQWYAAFFNHYKDADRVEWDALQSFIKLSSANADPAHVAITMQYVERLKQEPNESLVMGITNKLHSLDLAGRAGAILTSYNNGEEVELEYQLGVLIAEAKRQQQSGGVGDYFDKPISAMRNLRNDEGGLQFTMFDLLNMTMRGARPGDNIAICAPTDSGKTSLMMKFTEHWARQGNVLYPTRPALYLVNEGNEDQLQMRFIQTVLGLSLEDMFKMTDAQIEAKYEEKMGHRSRVRFKNVHGKNLMQVEQIIEHHNPYLCITDMTGRIKAPSNKSGGKNDIGQLEEVWNGVREIATIGDLVHLGTVQVSMEGMEQLHPPLTAMQDSKVGIQTTLEACVMMGRRTDMPAIRGISTPKNKMARSKCSHLNMFETGFEPEINRWFTGTPP